MEEAPARVMRVIGSNFSCASHSPPDRSKVAAVVSFPHATETVRGDSCFKLTHECQLQLRLQLPAVAALFSQLPHRLYLKLGSVTHTLLI